MSGAIKKALENLEEIVPAGADGSYYQGQKLAEKRCQEVAAFPGIDGCYVDLTREQFDLYDIPIVYEPNEQMKREYCGKNPDTKGRYHQLQKNIIRYLKIE